MLGSAKHLLGLAYNIISSVFTTLQIGDVIIHSEDYWTDSEGTSVYSLLALDGSTFDETLYPKLYEVLGTNILEDLDNPEGSEVGYKIVADLN